MTDLADGSASGGGGAHGFVGSTLPTSAVKGGAGGKGGNADDGPPWVPPAGGGGGGGGYSAVVIGDGAYLTGTLSANVTGGNGGAGGDGTSTAEGGSGGIGLLFVSNAAASARFTINGAVTGGNGGAGGVNRGNGGVGLYLSNESASPVQLTITNAVSGGNGGAAGSGGRAGSGGAGLVGSNMNVMMAAGGGITGGMNGDSVTRASAITFTGGANFLTFNNATSHLFGNVDVTGLLEFAQSAHNVDVANSITGTGSIRKTGAATVTLSGTNTYTGATVNTGGTLGGNGIVGNTTINGGTLSPGNSIGLLTVQGNLVFTAASSYMVEVSPSNADRVNVTGTATLGGATVNASFATGSYITKQYTIVNAAGGVIGTFGSQVNTNLPTNFTSSLSYDTNNAYLNLTLNYAPPDYHPLNANQQNVGNALVGFFNRTGGIPLVFGALTPAGLTQASGEVGTGAQQTTFGEMGQFVGLLTGPGMGCASLTQGGDDCLPAARGSGVSGYANDTLAYAPSPRKRTEDAFAMFTKAPSVRVRDPHWSVWAMGFGGTQNTDGNANVGSNTATSRIYGMAVGTDYRFSPSTIAGFAMAGGGTNFSVANGGNGRSDLFQTGVYLRHTNGPAYVSAALAYGWQDITTDRTVSIAGIDRLHARFNANAWSGRVEGGYRIVAPWIGGVGITPYAAAQVTRFDLPSYAEQVLSGAGNFALSYAAKSVTDTRSELGLRTDRSFALQDGVVTLRGRLAWAHDFNPDRSIAATFVALPGASFITNGAAQASNSVLTTASAEMKWLNGWSVSGTFEGEFSNVTRSYAGKGVVRYAW